MGATPVSENVKLVAQSIVELCRLRLFEKELLLKITKLILKLNEWNFLEDSKFVLQKRNDTTGEWQSINFHIHGRTKARELLNKEKDKDPDSDWRVVPKVVADAYKQGWNDHKYFAKYGKE
jgi:hypothetical protein